MRKTMNEFYQHFAEPNRLWGQSLEFFLTFVWALQLSLQEKIKVSQESQCLTQILV